MGSEKGGRRSDTGFRTETGPTSASRTAVLPLLPNALHSVPYRRLVVNLFLQQEPARGAVRTLLR